MANKNDRNQKVDSDRDTTNMDIEAGEALGTAGGGVVGAAVGSVLGPIGTIAGGIAGAALGNKAGDAVDNDDNNSK
ncbi:glycine zipper domain-containing protein [Paenibacillus sp. NPDC093718]|uniref:glycine zipper domain-containing protein n=1 Tax=Paenibacillus sp. NPDC093718 TaxID=3390601 RepID=UPI003D02E072